MQQDQQIIQLFYIFKTLCWCTEREVGGPTAGVIDPRRSRIWTTVGGKIVGTDQGQNQYQVKITQQILHLNLVQVSQAKGANRAAQVAAGSSKAGVNVAFWK
jgi:hypothetical protein